MLCNGYYFGSVSSPLSWNDSIVGPFGVFSVEVELVDVPRSSSRHQINFLSVSDKGSCGKGSRCSRNVNRRLCLAIQIGILANGGHVFSILRNANISNR